MVLRLLSGRRCGGDGQVVLESGQREVEHDGDDRDQRRPAEDLDEIALRQPSKTYRPRPPKLTYGDRGGGHHLDEGRGAGLS